MFHRKFISLVVSAALVTTTISATSAQAQGPYVYKQQRHHQGNEAVGAALAGIATLWILGQIVEGNKAQTKPARPQHAHKPPRQHKPKAHAHHGHKPRHGHGKGHGHGHRQAHGGHGHSHHGGHAHWHRHGNMKHIHKHRQGHHYRGH